MARVRKAVIPTAGWGTRHYPASAAVPKEFFPLVDRDGITRPVIQNIIQEAVDSGIEQICIVIAPGQEKVYRQYFGPPDPHRIRALAGKDWAIRESQNIAELGERLVFVEQATPEGFGHAVYQARKFVGDNPFLLMLGDHVYISDAKERCARQIIEVYEQHTPAAVTGVQLTPASELHLFGVIAGEPIDPAAGVYRARCIIEKPSAQQARQSLVTPGLADGQYLAHFGLHVFSPEIFDSLKYLIANNQRERGEVQLTTAQEHLRRQTGNYLCKIVEGRRFDTGNPLGLLKTQIAHALQGIHRDESRAAFAADE
ncbi:MAG TPA: sugar phosphate nucleotidyltransferase [Tepidisphaeraceae bacterium]|nr:sugar phosphate nucleotidyltransferase [Tepidisphaeraceae bacterium]